MPCHEPQAHPDRCGCPKPCVHGRNFCMTCHFDKDAVPSPPPIIPLGGFEDDEPIQNCAHPQHNPPNGLYIPPGKRYRHICPGCGFTMLIRSQGAAM